MKTRVLIGKICAQGGEVIARTTDHEVIRLPDNRLITLPKADDEVDEGHLKVIVSEFGFKL